MGADRGAGGAGNAKGAFCKKPLRTPFKNLQKKIDPSFFFKFLEILKGIFPKSLTWGSEVRPLVVKRQTEQRSRGRPASYPSDRYNDRIFF